MNSGPNDGAHVERSLQPQLHNWDTDRHKSATFVGNDAFVVNDYGAVGVVVVEYGDFEQVA